MVNEPAIKVSVELGIASDWVQRWSPLVPAQGMVLDIACGQGRHMKWFSDRGHTVIGIDRTAEAIASAGKFGQVVLADIESGPWPLLANDLPCQFDAVIVTNYLWRPLFPVIAQSISPGGLIIYETFAQGNETVGKPSRPDFLLRPAELLLAFGHLQIVAFEQGFLEDPPRFIQRIVATRPKLQDQAPEQPARHLL